MRHTVCVREREREANGLYSDGKALFVSTFIVS